MTRLTVRLDDDLADWVADEAERRDRSKAYVVEEAVAAHRSDTHDTDATRSDANGTDSDRTDAHRIASKRLDARLTAIEEQLAELTDDGETDTHSEDETPTPQGVKTPLHEPEKAVAWARENTPASRKEIVAECYDGDAVDVNSDTWWRKRARPALEEAGMEFTRNRGWE